MKPLLIEMTFDFICPWCLIGKRNLEKALSSLARTRPDVPVRLRWKGVQLLPDLPAEGVPFEAFYLKRLGSAEMVQARQAQVREAAAHAGVNLDLKQIQVMPNTANAHRLLALAAEQGSARQLNNLLERLFASYFQQGYDIGQGELLLRLARSCGYNERRLEGALFDDGRPYVADDADRAGTAVPSFVIDQRIPLVGAQPPWLILAQLQRALEPPMPVAECLA